MGFPYRSFFSKLYEKSFEDHIFDSAAQVGFYFSFALFPLLLFLISLFGAILGAAARYEQALYFYLQQIMPFTAFALVRSTLEAVAQNSSGGKITIGLAVALWSASAGIDSLRIALNRVNGFTEMRSWFHTKSLSLALTFLLTMLIAAALIGVFQGWQILSFIFRYMGYAPPGQIVLVAIQWLVTLFILFVIFDVLYNILPYRRPITWKWNSPGAIVGIGLWLALSYGWKTYLQYFDNYDKIYGSIGAGIVLMLWLYLTALAILIGGMINSIMHELKRDGEAAGIVEFTEEKHVDNAAGDKRTAGDAGKNDPKRDKKA